MNKKSASLTEGPLFTNIIKFTVPIILTSILQLLFNAADLVVMGKFCGSIAVGAVGAPTPIINLIINLFIGMSIGAGVTVAHAYGRNDEKALHRTVHTAIPVAALFGLIITVVGITTAEPLLRLIDLPEDILPMSALYMKIYFAGMVFNMIYNFSASILRAVGDSKSPLIFLTIAGVVNVILNLFFVIVLRMEVAGVALATAISQAVSAVLVLIALMRRTDGCRLVLGKIKFYRHEFTKIVRIGFPAGIQGTLFSISTTIIQSSINSFGSAAISGSSAAANLEAFVYMCLYAFNQTAVTFIGQNMGAGNYKRVLKSLWMCLGCVTVVGLVGGIIAYAFAPQLLSIYISDSPEAIAHGVIRMMFICIPYFLCGVMDVTTGALRGMGASVAPMLISIVGICAFRVFWVYTIFKATPTPECLYVSFPISWAVTFLAQFITFFIVYKKQKKMLSPETILQNA